MNYQQLVQPNLSTVGNIGYCLAFAENVFSTPHLYPTATAAWEATQLKHQDRNFPNVAVPVWFSYFEGGVNLGHVAVRLPDGRVLSSPYQQENTHVIFGSIDQCAQVLNCTYLGWSEDLATVRIIKGETMAVITTEQRVALALGTIGTQPQDPADAAWDGKDDQASFDAMITKYSQLGQAHQADLAQQLANLQKEYDDLKVLKAQEQATPDVPPVPPVVPVVINDPLSPAPAPDSPSTPVDTPPAVPPEGQGSEQNPNIPTTLSTPLKVAIGAIIALLIALAVWIH